MSNLHRLKKEDVKPAAGRDIDAWCSRCKTDLGHTIVAMIDTTVAQVRCNTCGGTHRYRSGEPTVKKAATGKRKPTKASIKAAAMAVERAKERFLKRLVTMDTSEAINYSPRLNPERGDLIRHVKFGLGIVERVANDKANVSFEVGEKLLVVGR